MANTQIATQRAECNSKRTKIELLHAAWLALDDFSNTHIETDEDMADMHEIVLRIERRMAEIPATTGREWACKLSLAPDYLKNTAPILDSVLADIALTIETRSDHVWFGCDLKAEQNGERDESVCIVEGPNRMAQRID